MSTTSQPRSSQLKRWRIPIIIEAVAILAIVAGLIVARVIESTPVPTSRPSRDQQARAHDDPILYGYGWIDQKSGIAHIPIQRAIDIVVQNGLPTRPAIAPAVRDDGLTIPSYSSSGTQPEQILH